MRNAITTVLFTSILCFGCTSTTSAPPATTNAANARDNGLEGRVEKLERDYAMLIERVGTLERTRIWYAAVNANGQIQNSNIPKDSSGNFKVKISQLVTGIYDIEFPAAECNTYDAAVVAGVISPSGQETETTEVTAQNQTANPGHVLQIRTKLNNRFASIPFRFVVGGAQCRW